MANNNKMNIIEVIIQLRNDLKLWVTNNLRVKADKFYVDEKVATVVDEAKIDASNKDIAVLAEVQSNLSNYYTKTEIDSLELITIDEIDAICGITT